MDKWVFQAGNTSFWCSSCNHLIWRYLMILQVFSRITTITTKRWQWLVQGLRSGSEVLWILSLMAASDLIWIDRCPNLRDPINWIDLLIIVVINGNAINVGVWCTQSPVLHSGVMNIVLTKQWLLTCRLVCHGILSLDLWGLIKLFWHCNKMRKYVF